MFEWSGWPNGSPVLLCHKELPVGRCRVVVGFRKVDHLASLHFVSKRFMGGNVGPKFMYHIPSCVYILTFHRRVLGSCDRAS